MIKGDGCDFGYNCKLFLPTLGKCRKLIDSYTTRQELVERRWLSTRELVVYLGVPSEELVRRITAGEIGVRLQQDGKVIYQISASWQYDDCYLLNSGGQCIYFALHNGVTISCIAGRRGLQTDHPNMSLIPSEGDVRSFESVIRDIIGKGAVT